MAQLIGGHRLNDCSIPGVRLSADGVLLDSHYNNVTAINLYQKPSLLSRP